MGPLCGSPPYIGLSNATFHIHLPRDRDNDKNSGNCATSYSGGWWYNNCYHAKLTGQHSATKSNDGKYIRYSKGGQRGGYSWDSWAEAEMLFVPT